MSMGNSNFSSSSELFLFIYMYYQNQISTQAQKKKKSFGRLAMEAFKKLFQSKDRRQSSMTSLELGPMSSDQHQRHDHQHQRHDHHHTDFGMETKALSLFRAILYNDAAAAEMALTDEPELLTNPLNRSNDFAVHLACRMGNDKLVESLLSRLEKDSPCLLKLDGWGQTPLTYIAVLGSIDMAQNLVRNNRSLIQEASRTGKIPLQIAAAHDNGHLVRWMVDFIHRDELEENVCVSSLFLLIEKRMYGAANRLLGKMNWEPIFEAVHKRGTTVLHHIAQQTPDKDWRDFFSDVWKKYQQLYTSERIVELNVVGKDSKKKAVVVASSSTSTTNENEQDSTPELLNPSSFMQLAVSAGNLEFLNSVLSVLPELILSNESDVVSMCRVAAFGRELEILKLLKSKMGDHLFHILALREDTEGNNLLHIAAKGYPRISKFMPCPPYKLDNDYNNYLLVADLLPKACVDRKNKFGLTPEKMFMSERATFIADCNKWYSMAAKISLIVIVMMTPLIFGDILSISPNTSNRLTSNPMPVTNVLYFEHFVEKKVLPSVRLLTMAASTVSVITFWLLVMLEFDTFSPAAVMLLTTAITTFMLTTMLVPFIAYCALIMSFDFDLKIYLSVVGAAHVIVTLVFYYPAYLYLTKFKCWNGEIDLLVKLRRIVDGVRGRLGC